MADDPKKDSGNSSPPDVACSLPPTIPPPPLPLEYRTATAPPLPPRDKSSWLEDLGNVQDIKDILHYADAMSAENPQASQAKRDEENMTFLSDELSSLTVNVHEQLNNAINILLDTLKKERDLNYAFDILAELVHNIDFGNDFEQIGGFKVFTPCLASKYGSVRIRTAELIAVVVQNNPHCQERFVIRPSYIRMLMHLSQEDSDITVRTKCLFAISCLVRDNVDVFWKFIELGGDRLVLYVLNSYTSKELIKILFLVLSTSAMNIAISELYINIGVVDKLCFIILNIHRRLDPLNHDLVLITLRQFLDQSPKRSKEICAKFNKLKTFLPQLKSEYPEDKEFEDAKDLIDALMLLLEP